MALNAVHFALESNREVLKGNSWVSISAAPLQEEELSVEVPAEAYCSRREAC